MIYKLNQITTTHSDSWKLNLCRSIRPFMTLGLFYLCRPFLKNLYFLAWQHEYTPRLFVLFTQVREAAKKSSFTNGQAIKALPPPPLELNGHRNLFLFSLKIVENGFWQLFFSPQFLDKINGNGKICILMKNVAKYINLSTTNIFLLRLP